MPVAAIGGIGAAVSLGGMHGLGGFYAVIGVVWIFILIIFIVELIIMLWLRPYITGCVAKFYDFLRGSQPLNQGGWSGPGGGDPWDRKTREQKDAWDYSSYTWSSGRPSNPAGNLNPPAPQDQTEAQGGGKGGSQGGTEEPPQDGQPPRGPNYPKY